MVVPPPLSPSPLPSGRRVAAAVALWVAAGLLAACSGGSGGAADDPLALERSAPNPGALPTLAGGVELARRELAQVLVARDLTFGAPLPSEQAAAEAYAELPEVSGVAARRVYGATSGRVVAEVLVLRLDGTQIFDVGVLDAFVEGVVAALGGAPVVEAPVGGRTALRSVGLDRAAEGFREGDLLVVTHGPVAADVALVVERQLAALAAGELGPPDPVTPLIPLPIDAAFVALPTVAFAPFPTPEEAPDEVVPTAPALPGATGVVGRYGVVAGERRTTVWAFTVDPATYPTAEALAPALQALAAGRAGGASVADVELVDRVVHVAVGGEDQPSATAFRHQGLVLLVEGLDPTQVEAVVTAWIQDL